MFATHSAMLIHMESGNCRTTQRNLDRFAQWVYQSKKYVVPGFEDYLRGRRRQDRRAKGSNNHFIEKWQCDECRKTSQTEAGLQRHLNSPVHNCLSFRCPDCKMEFPTLSGLVQHAESLSCEEEIRLGSIGKMLHFIHMRLTRNKREAYAEDSERGLI
ncbi:hypothetical protein MMC12_003759 [Toensbergia leucococca]|nr:hypothetical protein [Toensbergia leucococca]